MVYQALYGDFGLWVRPLEMFCGTVELDGETVPRFALIEAEPAGSGRGLPGIALDRNSAATI